MKRIITVIISAILLACLVGCSTQDVVWDKTKTYEITSEIHSLDIQINAAVLGESDLKFGVRESNVTLIGSKDDYKVDIEKGLGNITVDGKTVTDFCSSGNGQNHIEIEGGAGTINLKFQEK